MKSQKVPQSRRDKELGGVAGGGGENTCAEALGLILGPGWGKIRNHDD